MTSVVLAGALANKHGWGGSAWVRMSWAEALRDLGFDVLFVDQISEADCHDSDGRPSPFETSAEAGAFGAITSAFGFEADSALVCADDCRTLGISREELEARVAVSPLLVNLSGHLRLPWLTRHVPCRAFVDLDPAYTQIWHAQGLDDAGLEDHHLHFSIGANVGGPSWDLPTAGVDWTPIRQPVVLDRWPVAPDEDDGFAGFSTVARWRGAFGSPVWAGKTYGVKAHAFRRFADLPSMVDQDFSIVLDIDGADSADRQRLTRGGWRVLSPEMAGGIYGFRNFVQGSGAEFSVAQDIYVQSRSGWFSDRTVRYLASGRPALVQNTGFAGDLPVGEGLVPFDDLDGAISGARAITDDYPRHRAGARSIAERFFAPQAALAPLLDAAGLSS